MSRASPKSPTMGINFFPNKTFLQARSRWTHYKWKVQDDLVKCRLPYENMSTVASWRINAICGFRLLILILCHYIIQLAIPFYLNLIAKLSQMTQLADRVEFRWKCRFNRTQQVERKCFLGQSAPYYNNFMATTRHAPLKLSENVDINPGPSNGANNLKQHRSYLRRPWQGSSKEPRWRPLYGRLR